MRLERLVLVIPRRGRYVIVRCYIARRTFCLKK